MHTLTWLIWIGTLFAAALSTRNPLYLLELALVATIVSGHFARLRGKPEPAWLLRFAAFVIPASTLFNALTIHIGDTVLFTLPGNIPLFSGPVTLEAAVYGAINGLVLVTTVAIFSVISSGVPARQLVRSTPRAFQSLGITAGIALNFVPQTMRRLSEVREAQAVRGHRVKGLRDWLPLWMPLLMGGLEQAMQLSEAMVARGFGAANSRAASIRTRLLLLAGLALLLAGWLLQFAGAATIVSTGLMLAGGASVVGGLWWNSRSIRHTTYRPMPFTRLDLICCLLAAGAAVIVLMPVPFIDHSTLAYNPYPALSLPGFDPVLGLLMLAWLAPMLVRSPSV